MSAPTAKKQRRDLRRGGFGHPAPAPPPAWRVKLEASIANAASDSKHHSDDAAKRQKKADDAKKAKKASASASASASRDGDDGGGRLGNVRGGDGAIAPPRARARSNSNRAKSLPLPLGFAAALLGAASKVTFGAVNGALPLAVVLAVKTFRGRRERDALSVLAVVSGGVSIGGIKVISPPATPLPLPAFVPRMLAPLVVVRVAPSVLSVAAPGVLRTLRFYGHLFPVIAGYLKCLLIDSKRLAATGASEDEIQDAWDAKHAWGASRVADMIHDLGGFYLKVGQVFATKSDLLPPQYVSALKGVFDECPPVPFAEIAKIVEEDLGSSVTSTFFTFQQKPIASATIAQVHAATLRRVLLTLVPIRPRRRGERRSLRTFSPGASLRPGSLAFNPDTPRRLSTPPLTPFNSTPTCARMERLVETARERKSPSRFKTRGRRL